MPRRKKKSNNKNTKKGKQESGIEKFGKDEVDAFHDAKEFVAVDTNKDQDESSEDEAVMGLNNETDSSSSSSSSEEEDEEEEQREEAVDIRTGVASEDEENDSSSSSESDSNDSDSNDEDPETMGRRAIGWGTKRKTFYASEDEEVAEDSDEEALQVEEAERQQKMRAKTTKDTDFQIDDSDDDEDFEEQTKTNKKKKKKNSKKKNKEDIEEIQRDPNLVSVEEKLTRLRNEAPELLALLSDFKEKSSELRNTIRPVLAKVKAGELATESGVDYLEVKHQLLLNYCINLTFYLYMRAKGQSVQNHPVIKQLVHLRTIMEKLQPVDKKVRYQIDKLLEKTSGLSKDDATRFGPNVDDLAADSDEDVNDDEDTKQELYRAPRMSAVMYDEDESKSAKEERRREKAEARLKKSAILRELHEDWTDQPLKRSATGAAGHTGNEELEQWQRDRTKYEEENFVRLQPTKKRKKQIKAASRAMNSAAFGDLTDFGDIELLKETNNEAMATNAMRRDHQAALHRQINQLEQKRRQSRKRGATSGDADMGIVDPDVLEARRRTQNDRARDLMEESYEDRFTKAFNDDNDDQMLLGTVDAEDEFYKKAKATQKDLKRKRKEKYAVQPMMTAADDVTDGSRLASRMILKNRGLVPHRKRENRNPRIVRKKKYEKAKKRRKGQVRELRTGEAHQYGGEMSGIRTDISRSRKMK